MPDNKGQTNNRRRLLRLDDTITVRYHPVAADCAGKDPYLPEFNIPAHFELQSELTRIETANRHFLRVIASESRELSLYLGALSRKIDLLASALATAPEDAQLAAAGTTLSEGGISLPLDTGCSQGELLHLLIHNTTARYNFAAIGRIAHVRNESDGPVTGIEFTSLRDSDRQLIFRYLMRKQRDSRQIDPEQAGIEQESPPVE